MIFDKQRIHIGDTPARNLIELARKIPYGFFGDFKDQIIDKEILSSEKREEFSREYKEFCVELADYAYNLEDLKTFNLDTLKKHSPRIIIRLFELLKQRIENEGSLVDQELWNLKTLMHSGAQNKYKGD